MKWHQEIIDAISRQHVLRIYHLTLRSDPIDIEPHAYGLNERRVRVLYAWNRAYQRVDEDHPKAWKFWVVDEIEGLSIASLSFGGSRRGYSTCMPQIPTIYARL